MDTISNGSTELLQKLKETDWLYNGGREPNPQDITAYKFANKSEAGKLLLGKHWDDTLIHARNGCSSILSQTEMKRWNPIAKSVRSAVNENGCCNDAADAVASHFGFDRKEVHGILINYFHFACVELEYEGFLKPGFFAELCHICMQGRLPCGLDGDFPNGQIVVY